MEVLLQQQRHDTAVAAARREHAAAVAGIRARWQVRAARAQQLWEQEVEEKQREHERKVGEVRDRRQWRQQTPTSMELDPRPPAQFRHAYNSINNSRTCV